MVEVTENGFESFDERMILQKEKNNETLMKKRQAGANFCTYLFLDFFIGVGLPLVIN